MEKTLTMIFQKRKQLNEEHEKLETKLANIGDFRDEKVRATDVYRLALRAERKAFKALQDFNQKHRKELKEIRSFINALRV